MYANDTSPNILVFMDAKKYSSAAQRNRQPILEVLKNSIPDSSNILEIASGTGEHAVFLASRFPNCQWYPSDRDPQLRASIQAWKQEYFTANLHPPLDIDARDKKWQIEEIPVEIDVIVNINMIHIAPFSACEGLMAGAERILSSKGILYLYGPYKKAGKHTAASNEAFDRSLRDRDSQWGVRNLEDVVALAKTHHLQLQKVVEMPANNLSVIFQRI